jgi:hypothetical protein
MDINVSEKASAFIFRIEDYAERAKSETWYKERRLGTPPRSLRI